MSFNKIVISFQNGALGEAYFHNCEIGTIGENSKRRPDDPTAFCVLTVMVVRKALEQAGTDIPLKTVIVGIDGTVEE